MVTIATEADGSVNEAARCVRRRGAGLLAVVSLVMAPPMAVRAADDQPHESTISIQAKSFGAAVKRDAKAVGAGCKEGAHRVAVAAKALGHEVATAAKRGAAETKAAFRGGKDGMSAT